MRLTCMAALLGLAACAPVAGGGAGADVDARRVTGSDTAATDTAAGNRSADLPPAGYGTLRQEEFTVSLRHGALLIKVTPLVESVIRLAAPDTYGRLHALAASRRGAIARDAGLSRIAPFLVSFFSYEPDVTFQPADIQLEHQGRLLRPLAIQPITPGWGRQRLRQQETQSAVYAFDPSVDLSLELAVRYGFERSDAWNRIIPRLESERTRVFSQVGS